LRPLPYPEADRLVWIGETLKGNTTDQVTLTLPGMEGSQCRLHWDGRI
jgi:hypothetical protein